MSFIVGKFSQLLQQIRQERYIPLTNSMLMIFNDKRGKLIKGG